jgi:tetratricopeptide (TPR) repeat protein
VGSVRLRSDGALILQVLRDGSTAVSPGDVLKTLAGLRGLWRETGDLHCLHAHLLAAANAWVELGDAARAGELLDEARALPVQPVPAFRAYQALVAAEVGLAAEDCAVAGKALAEAEEAFRQTGHGGGELLTGLARVELLRAGGRPTEALRLCEALAGNQLVESRPSLRDGLLVLRLHCEADLPVGEPERLLKAFERLPARRRTPVRTLSVYLALGRCHRRQGEAVRAAEAYRKALAAVHALDESLAGPDRERFRRARAGLVEEARDCSRKASREEKADWLDQFFPPPGEENWRKEQARRLVQRRLLRRGVGLTCFNVIVAATLVGAAAWVKSAGPPSTFRWTELWQAPFWAGDVFGRSAGFLVVLLIAFTACAPVLGALLALVRWVSGGLRRAGEALLVLGILPWFFWLIGSVMKILTDRLGAAP